MLKELKDKLKIGMVLIQTHTLAGPIAAATARRRVDTHSKHGVWLEILNGPKRGQRSFVEWPIVSLIKSDEKGFQICKPDGKFVRYEWES